jgi:hypothetical protein
MDYIKNEDLKLDKIPKSLEEGEAGLYFSHTFDGYKFCGSFEGCADISRKVQEAIKENNTEELLLSEIRTCLFFYFRALRHGDGQPDKLRVDKLLNLIRERVADNKFE